MEFKFSFFFLIFVFQKINPFLIISMQFLEANDCLRKIELGDGNIIFEKKNSGCNFENDKTLYNLYSYIPIPYEIGQKIKIVIGGIRISGGEAFCGFKVKLTINDNILDNKEEFWSCDNCEGGVSFKQKFDLNCFPGSKADTNEKNYTFNFQINSLQQLKMELTDYFYILNKKRDFFISFEPDKVNGKINLIGLHSIDNLYYLNSNNEKIAPLYEYIYYKLFFDVYSNHEGKFYGSDESNNDLELNESTYSNIFNNKSLRYELSNDEKKKNGTYLKLRIGIFDKKKKPISELQEFNFFICMEGYKFCNLETSMKCIKEGYYQINDRYYSCYKTCKICNKYKKPDEADYFNNYCDECKEEYSYFINIKENGKEYKSCYEKCPLHAPELKDYNEKECVSYCPRYKRSDGRCVDSCDYENFKYLLKNESMCYNYIPKNFFIFIDNYAEYYNNTNKPIIKLGERCPNDTYDSSFDNFCINEEEDIFHFIINPNELLKHNNPYIKNLETKEIVIRAYTSDKKLDDIVNNEDKLIQIDNSNCQEKIKKNYSIDEKESLIIQHR